jgi:hypothetical protein
MFMTESIQYDQVLLHSFITPAQPNRIVESEIRVCTHTHENWQILIRPCPKTCHWEFRCLPPDSTETLHDGETYCCKDDALAAAKKFVDKSKFWNEVSAPLDQWVDQGRITVREKNEVLSPIIQLLKRL